MPCQQGLEYTDYPLQESKTPSKRGVLGMTRNCTWWWDSSSGAQESVEYSFLAVTPKYTYLLESHLEVKIDLFKNYLYSIGLICKKKKTIS